MTKKEIAREVALIKINAEPKFRETCKVLGISQAHIETLINSRSSAARLLLWRIGSMALADAFDLFEAEDGRVRFILVTNSEK